MVFWWYCYLFSNLTPASLSWNSPLNITKIELELLTDVIMVLDYETNIMGEITRTVCHYGEANNKYMYDYDEAKESQCI